MDPAPGFPIVARGHLADVGQRLEPLEVRGPAAAEVGGDLVERVGSASGWVRSFSKYSASPSSSHSGKSPNAPWSSAWVASCRRSSSRRGLE